MSGGTSKEGLGTFDLTPHKISICHLIPAEQAVPFPFESTSHHNRLGLFLLAITRSCDGFVEPPLEELVGQLKVVGGPIGDWLVQYLIGSLTALLLRSDDLFNFFDKLRGVLVTPEGVNVEDDQIFLDPNSHLGVFLRCCILDFNLLSFEVENATILLLLAEIHRKSGNPVLGVPYSLACLLFCKSFNLDLLEASANLTLAELWLSLGSSHVKRASRLVYRILPLVLVHGGLKLRARANIALAKCYLSDPSFSVSSEPCMVLDPLSQAAKELQILEFHEMAAEAFYLMAMLYNSLGQLEKREEAAALFRENVIALENPLGSQANF